MAKVLLDGLRGAKQMGGRRLFSAGFSVPRIGRGYDFGREPFGPAYGVPVPIDSDGLPRSVDWRKVRGAVFPVNNQLNCGSCYMMAALGSVSSLAYITKGISYQLSVQHVLDANTITNYGCRGGSPGRVFNFMIRNGGVLQEIDYPYTAVRGVCKDVTGTGLTIESWLRVMPTEEDLRYAVAHQPIVVGISVDKDFENYKNGILKVPAVNGKPSHAVLLLGYDECAEGRYWIILNSWLESWGLNGTCWIPRETAHIDGALGILSAACFPLKASRVMVLARTESCPFCWIGKRTSLKTT